MEQDKEFLKKAIEQANKSFKQGGFPAGAIVVKNGKIISEGISMGGLLNDPTEHSETSAIRQACKKTDEMARKNFYEGLNKLEEINNKNNHRIVLEHIGDFEDEILEMIKKWEAKND